MAKTSLHAFKAKDTRFVAEWLKSKGLHKLCSVFEGIQEPFILSFGMCCLLNHVYIHSFRSIKAPEKFPGGGGIWSPGMDLRWGIWTAFRPREGGIWTKIFQKFKCPGGCPGGMLKLRFDWYITMNEHAIANVYLDLSFQLRIMFVKIILLQISFCAYTLRVNVKIFSTKFEGWCKYFSPVKLVSYGTGNWRRHATSFVPGPLQSEWHGLWLVFRGWKSPREII